MKREIAQTATREKAVFGGDRGDIIITRAASGNI